MLPTEPSRNPRGLGKTLQVIELQGFSQNGNLTNDVDNCSRVDTSQ